MTKPKTKTETPPPAAKRGRGRPRKTAETITAPAVPQDPWAEARAKAAERISLLTTKDCMRLYARGFHPNTLMVDITPHPEIADFRLGFAGDVHFSMGVRMDEQSPGTTAQMCGAVIGAYSRGHVALFQIQQTNWGKGDDHGLPLLLPLSEVDARIQGNGGFDMSIAMEGLKRVQLDRTGISMADILEGFLLAHRGLSAQELRRRYTYDTASRIGSLLAHATRYGPETDGRMTDWHGWKDVPVDRDRPRHKKLWCTKKQTHEKHAGGRYGTGERLLPPEDYEDIKVAPNPETRETVALLQLALNAVNLPGDAETPILSAIETLTVKRGKVYNNGY